ncbi:MAG: hypothetical protein ABIV11_01630 [Gemmatimonadaceae bacterium]
MPVLPLQIVLHNDGAEKVPDKYYREGIHYVTLVSNKWQQVVWEIEPIARDRVIPGTSRPAGSPSATRRDTHVREVRQPIAC